MKSIIVAIVSGLLLVIGFMLFSPSTHAPTSEFSKQEKIRKTKWRVVVSVHARQGESDVTRERRWVISPEGDAYIIPQAYQDWANKIQEGDSVIMPRTVHGWDRSFFEKKDVRNLMSGIIVDQGKVSNTSMWMESVYFFDN